MTSNAQMIAEAQSNLPLPEQPPVASDWNSLDERNVNVGSGKVESGISHGANASSNLREPAVTDDVGSVGRQAKDGLSGLPDDAVARGQKGHSATEATTK